MFPAWLLKRPVVDLLAGDFKKKCFLLYFTLNFIYDTSISSSTCVLKNGRNTLFLSIESS